MSILGLLNQERVEIILIETITFGVNQSTFSAKKWSQQTGLPSLEAPVGKKMSKLAIII